MVALLLVLLVLVVLMLIDVDRAGDCGGSISSNSDVLLLVQLPIVATISC